MQLRFLPLAALIVLGACDGAKDSANNVLDTTGNETSASYNKVRDMVGLPHKPKADNSKPAQPRYCYMAFEDVVCYSHPRPGQDERLTGYQDAQGHVGYVMPEDGIMVDQKNMPPLKAVTVGAPPTVLGSTTIPQAAPPPPKKRMKEITFDPAEVEPKELVPTKQE